MTKQIFRSILAVSMTVLLASLVLITGVLYGYFQDQILDELSVRVGYAARGVELDGTAYLESGLSGDDRITWVDSDGTVLYDNTESADDLDNHAQREEIQEALKMGRGWAVRYSDTLAQQTIYYAVRLSDGTVLRLADTQYSAWTLVVQVLQPMAAMILLALVLALVLSSALARKIVRPINAIDPNDPSGADTYEELAPLLTKLRSQRRQIHQQILDLRRRQQEFTAITENMSEGFLVIDPDTRVLSYNSAVVRLLRAQKPGEEGVTALELNREAGFRRCVEEALAGRRCEEMLERDDECRRVIASPVERDGRVTGAVLVILDVTEKEQREALRREFTANVSHELKTPLTSILGTAEILENNMVQPADIPHFAGNIRRETERLIGLVNDIIKLSRLDEGGPAGNWETVDLHQLAGRVLDQLSDAAGRKDVTMELRGETALARGVPQIVEEVVYNLCDNAVAYNRQGGSVTVTVENTPQGARVSVADTGIGIPRDAQSRVFERFYRVDKSHSSGGTGLGLSIVKHGAAYLGARVELESESGQGSTFTLIFPPVKN